MEDGPEEDAIYDFAPESPPRPPGGANVPTPASTVHKTLGYRAPKDDAPSSSDPEVIKNFQMPLWLLGGGVAIELVAACFRKGGPQAALVHVGVELIFGTAVMLAGILLAARWRQIDLGRFWTAVFKLAAIAVAPSAAVTLASPALNVIPLGWLLGWVGEFVLYFALLGALFDLDESDTWYCVLVIFLVRLAVYFTFLGIMAKWG